MAGEKQKFRNVEYERAQEARRKAEKKRLAEERDGLSQSPSVEGGDSEELRKAGQELDRPRGTSLVKKESQAIVPQGKPLKQEVGFPKGEKKKEKISFAVVETTQNVEDRARDVAEARLNKSKAELRGVSGFFKKVFKHNYLYDVFRQKEIARARKEILEKKNLYADEGESKEAHSTTYANIIKQFTHEYADQLVHKEAGEARKELGKETEGERKIAAKIRETVEKYAALDLTRPEVREGLERENNLILETVKAEQDAAPGSVFEKNINRERTFATNLEQTVRLVQEKIKEGKKLEELDLDFNIVLGRARSGVRTEAQQTAVDSALEKIQQNKLGALLVNEMGFGVAVATAYSISGAGLQRLLSSQAAALLSLGGTALAAGTIAGFRENRRFKMDRAQHARQMAQGSSIAESSPRREEMERSRYETKHVGLLQNSLSESVSFVTPEHLSQVAPEIQQQRISTALDALSEIERRVARSDKEQIDLIEFTDSKEVGRERFELDIARAEAKVALRKALADNPQLAERFGSIESALESRMQNQDGKLQEDIDTKNRIYEKLRNKNVRNAALIAAGTGLLGGLIAQEAIAFLKDDQVGAAEQLITYFRGKTLPKPDDATPLEWLRMKAAGLWGGGGSGSALVGGPVTGWAGSTCMRMPSGFSVQSTAGGVFDLMRNGEPVVRGLSVGQDGHLTEASKQLLSKQGISLTDNPTPGFNTNPTPERLAHEYKDRGMMKEITRKLWYDNNTTAFDKNELKTWWGGPGNKGVNANGDFTYTVKHMTPDGSFHGNQSVNPQELMKEGKLKMLFSISRGTQNVVFEIPIAQDGTVTIDRNSEAGRMLFKVGANGQAQFMGAFGEVAHSVGRAPNGADTMQILGTHVGADQAKMPLPCKDVVVTVPQDWSPRFAPPPFVVPFAPRTPLEPVGKRKGQQKVAPVPKEERVAGQRLTTDQRPKFEAITNERGSVALEDKRFTGDIDPAMQRMARLIASWEKDMKAGNTNRASAFIESVYPESKKQLAVTGRRVAAQRQNLNAGQYKRFQKQLRGFKKTLESLNAFFGGTGKESAESARSRRRAVLDETVREFARNAIDARREEVPQEPAPAQEAAAEAEAEPVDAAPISATEKRDLDREIQKRTGALSAEIKSAETRLRSFEQSIRPGVTSGAYGGKKGKFTEAKLIKLGVMIGDILENKMKRRDYDRTRIAGLRTRAESASTAFAQLLNNPSVAATEAKKEDIRKRIQQQRDENDRRMKEIARSRRTSGDSNS